MNSIDDLDRRQKIIQYIKYAFVLLIIVFLIIFLLKGCNHGYTDIESSLITATKKYIKENNIVVSNRKYIEITKLGDIDGTELCKKASGVIVTNNNGTLSYEPYLKCDGYETTLKKKYKYIDLIGDDVLLLNKGEVYEEKYYTLKSDADVTISGKVGTDVGLYTINYYVYVNKKLKETAQRIVIVTENDKNQNVTALKNEIEPTLTLIGDTYVVLGVGQKYHETGYTAIDYNDGKISRKVKVNPNPEKIDTSKPKEYNIYYSVTNSKGITTVATRKIVIVRYKTNLDINLTKSTDEITKSLKIKVNIVGDGYERTIYPITEVRSSYEYPVTSNGTYKFRIEDIYKNITEKVIEIDNNENDPPSGSCSALVRGSNTEVEVNAEDNKGISGYKYILDTSSTDFMENNSYKVSNASKEISVVVKDIAGNQTNIKCDVTIKKETTVAGRASGSSIVIDTSEYRLVSTKNDTIEFAKLVDNMNIAQNHPPTYPGACLAFSYYHAYLLYNGNNLTSMTAEGGNSYMYAGRFRAFENDDKEVVLSKIYELINEGQPVILQVNGNTKGTSRHYVTVVGYKNTVTSESDITEEDLLIIDSYDGKLERMDRNTSRFMISGYDTSDQDQNYGYQIYILRQ